MNKPLYEKDLERVDFRYGYFQIPGGIFHGDYNIVGEFYIHQIIIKRDIKDRYEPLYSTRYDDYMFNESKFIENKTYSGLVNFIDKQKLMTEENSVIELILSSCIPDLYDLIVNGIEFIVKEKHDFEEEKLPMKKI